METTFVLMLVVDLASSVGDCKLAVEVYETSHGSCHSQKFEHFDPEVHVMWIVRVFAVFIEVFRYRGGDSTYDSNDAVHIYKNGNDLGEHVLALWKEAAHMTP